MALRDIRILVAIDFGTTYSGFAFVHTENQNNVETNNTWPGREGVFKTPTALLYNETYTEVKSWGDLALEEEPEYVTDDIEEIRHRPVELFKLHISDLKNSQKPWLPPQLDYKKAIEDYLTQMKVLIKDTLEKRWPTIRFPQQIGFVLTIPAEWPHNTTGIMRECAYKAGLLTTLNSSHLEFTTEPEAAALYCLNVVKEHNLRPGDTFLVADCGGGTVDITSRKLRQDNKLSEITERIGELCGSTFVDKEFLHWLGRKVGFQALEKLKRLNYGQMQHLIQQFFCHLVKFKFKNDTNFRPIRLILHKYCPDLQQYVTGEHKEQMEDAGWIVRLDYESVKEMFDPVINKILKLIEGQLIQAKERCSAIFLVGGFSESPYLLSRVRETFIDQVPIIAVPALPIAAVVRGAITYGLNVEVVQERVLKWTYGIEVCRSWVAGKDKKIRKTSDGLIFYFYKLAQRRTRVDVDKKFSGEFVPVRANQTNIVFNIYYTARDSARFCDEPGMKLLGTLRINTPDTHLGLNRPVEFSLTFAKMEIKASAINKRNGKIYDETTFELDI